MSRHRLPDLHIRKLFRKLRHIRPIFVRHHPRDGCGDLAFVLREIAELPFVLAPGSDVVTVALEWFQPSSTSYAATFRIADRPELEQLGLGHSGMAAWKLVSLPF